MALKLGKGELIIYIKLPVQNIKMKIINDLSAKLGIYRGWIEKRNGISVRITKL